MTGRTGARDPWLSSVLICGFERGGTTLLSQILRANGYESGFECGVLMAETPADFPSVKPYYDMLLPGWKISAKTREKAIGGDFAHFYRTIKVVNYEEHLSRGLQEKILDSTRLASRFFMHPVERLAYGSLWAEVDAKIDAVLDRHGLPRVETYVYGTYFEPQTYLLRNRDVLEAGLNPLQHYRKFGIREGRPPA